MSHIPSLLKNVSYLNIDTHISRLWSSVFPDIGLSRPLLTLLLVIMTSLLAVWIGYPQRSTPERGGRLPWSTFWTSWRQSRGLWDWCRNWWLPGSCWSSPAPTESWKIREGVMTVRDPAVRTVRGQNTAILRKHDCFCAYFNSSQRFTSWGL